MTQDLNPKRNKPDTTGLQEAHQACPRCGEGLLLEGQAYLTNDGPMDSLICPCGYRTSRDKQPKPRV